MKIYKEDIIFGLGITGIVIFLIYCIILAIVALDTDAKCLALGWKEAHITWDFKRYCSREENEYEITKPLEEIEKELLRKT